MTIAASLLLGLLLAAKDAPPSAEPPDCYDVVVKAKAIDQIPSRIPNCDDCLIMSWPWFLDLKVGRVVEGQVDAGVIRALSLQHTYMKARYGLWRLRRNTAGGFNVVTRWEGEAKATRCAPGTPAARPYLRSKDKTLDDLRNEGIKEYGHFPK